MHKIRFVWSPSIPWSDSLHKPLLLTDMRWHTCSSAFHATGCVHRVTKQTIAWHLHSNHSSYHRSYIQVCRISYSSIRTRVDCRRKLSLFLVDRTQYKVDLQQTFLMLFHDLWFIRLLRQGIEHSIQVQLIICNVCSEDCSNGSMPVFFHHEGRQTS